MVPLQPVDMPALPSNRLDPFDMEAQAGTTPCDHVLLIYGTSRSQKEKQKGQDILFGCFDVYWWVASWVMTPEIPPIMLDQVLEGLNLAWGLPYWLY